MRIRLEHKGSVFEFERSPMQPERFKAVCKLAGAAIYSGALLGAIALVGFWSIPWGVGALIVVLAGMGLIQMV